VFVSDCKLNQEAQIDMNISKKRKPHAKKITGFQVPASVCSSVKLANISSKAMLMPDDARAVCAGEPVGDPGDVGGLADPSVQRHHRAPKVQRYATGGTSLT
jgi:hypothetical protein